MYLKLNLGFALLTLAVVGCFEQEPEPAAPTKSQTKSESPKPEKTLGVETRKAQLGKGVWLETAGRKRRVLVDASVCMREGSYGLECLLCRHGTKEHESILHTDCDAELIHAGLLAAGANPGSPVRYKETKDGYETIPPTGSTIKVTLEYEDKGRKISVPAQHWIRNGKTHKEMEGDWVFAGSMFLENPENKKKPVYAATPEGSYICTSNVTTALLDLPIKSPRAIEARSFEPFTEHIPPEDTKVTIILESAAEKK
jgi:hypothetical protein